MDEFFKSNPLYKNVLEYLSKPRPKIPENRSFQIRRLTRILFIISAFFGLIIVIGILGLRQNLQKETSAPKSQPVLMSTVEPKIICKNFGSLEEALNTLNEASNNVDIIVCGLDLSGKGLTSLPPEITKLTTLNELILKNNNLTTFPVELLSFSALYTLDLSNNNIATISSQIQQKIAQDQQQAQESRISITLQSLKLTGNNISEDEKIKIKQLLPNVQIIF